MVVGESTKDHDPNHLICESILNAQDPSPISCSGSAGSFLGCQKRHRPPKERNPLHPVASTWDSSMKHPVAMS